MTHNKLLFASPVAEKSALNSIKTLTSFHVGGFDSSLSKTLNFIFWPKEAEMSSACQRIADSDNETVCFRITTSDLKEWVEDIKAEGEENDLFKHLIEEQEKIETIISFCESNGIKSLTNH